MSTQEKKIEDAITDLIDNVERFFSVAPLRFLDLDGGNDDIGCFTFPVKHETRFNRFESWFQNLLETLDPFYSEYEEAAKAAEEIIEEDVIAVFSDDEDVKDAWRVLNDSLTSLMFPAQHVGFYVGVFIGARRQGATHSDLVEIGKGLVMACVQQWEAAHRNAEADQKKIDKAAEAVAVVVVKDMRKQKMKGQRRDAFKLVQGGKNDAAPEILKGDFNL